MTHKIWFLLLIDLILVMLIVDTVITVEKWLPDSKPSNFVLWSN